MTISRTVTVTTAYSITLPVSAWRTLADDRTGASRSWCNTLDYVIDEAMQTIAERRIQWRKYRQCLHCDAAHNGNKSHDVTVTILAQSGGTTLNGEPIVDTFLADIRAEIAYCDSWAYVADKHATREAMRKILAQLLTTADLRG